MITTEDKKIKDLATLFTDAYLTAAKIFTRRQPFLYDSAKIWWLWELRKKVWEMIDETDILNALGKNSYIPTISSQARSQALESLKRIGRNNWKNNIQTPSIDWIQFKDKFVNYKTGETFDASPQYFTTNSIPWNLSENEETPILDKLFRDWVEEKHINLLYEIFAYCLIRSYPIQRVFWLIGKGANGKTTYLNILLKFLGVGNWAVTDLQTLMLSRFEMARLWKKNVAVMSETSSIQPIAETNRLKRLSGNEPIPFEIKHKNPFEDINYAKLIIATNKIPKTYDDSDGFHRRQLIISFPHRFTEERNIISEIPDKEYENLARKCIIILRELIERGKFTNELSIEDKKIEYTQLSDPLQVFLDTKCNINLGLDIHERFDNFFVEYSKTNRTATKKQLGKELRNKGFDVKPKNFKTDNGTYYQKTVIYGLELSVF